MCGRINVHDHGAVQALMNRLSVQIDPSRFVPRYNVAPGARSVVALRSLREYLGAEEHERITHLESIVREKLELDVQASAQRLM